MGTQKGDFCTKMAVTLEKIIFDLTQTCEASYFLMLSLLAQKVDSGFFPQLCHWGDFMANSATNNSFSAHMWACIVLRQT